MEMCDGGWSDSFKDWAVPVETVLFRNLSLYFSKRLLTNGILVNALRTFGPLGHGLVLHLKDMVSGRNQDSRGVAG